MSLALKKQMLAGLVLATLLWPLTQHGMVKYLGIDPWKLFGLAMYCTPHDVRVRITVEDESHVLDISQLTEETRHQVYRFVQIRRIAGRLIHPKDLAFRIMEERPDIRSLQIVIVTAALDPNIDLVVPKWTTYKFTRR